MRAVVVLLAGILAVGQAEVPSPLGQPDEALTRLFTPRSAPPGQYLVYRSTRPIEAVAGELRALDPAPEPGAWTPERPEAHDAFGQDGVYPRTRLARLFRGRRVTLIRGSLVREGRRVAYTLISPYPHPSLDSVESGTMTVVFAVPER